MGEEESGSYELISSEQGAEVPSLGLQPPLVSK